jgi:hypothetical protein
MGLGGHAFGLPFPPFFVGCFASLILSRSVLALGFVRATTCVTALGSILAS